MEVSMLGNAGLLMEYKGYLLPAWFRMKFVSPGTIVFLVHENVLGWFKEIVPSNFGSAQDYSEDLLLKSFRQPDLNSWGYNETIRTVESNEENWMRYEIDIPSQGKEGDELVYATAASISILAQALRMIKTKYLPVSDPQTLPQLLVFETGVAKRDMCGAPIQAFYSRIIVEWAIKHQNHEVLNEIACAMKQSESVMYPDMFEAEGVNRFEAYVSHSCYLVLGVGSRVALIPEGSKYNETDAETGYLVHGHNPDSITNQLALVAGLAKLYELVELDFYLNR